MSTEKRERSVTEIAHEIVEKNAEERLKDARRIINGISMITEDLAKNLIPFAIADVIAENQLGKVKAPAEEMFSKTSPRGDVVRAIEEIESKLGSLRSQLKIVGVISSPSKSFDE